jgi:hypothetical protein
MPNLIGTAPDQVPVNGFLGNMAFQNKEGVVTDLLSTTALTVTGTASFAGTIAAGLGSAAAPSYTFIGDTNTGIFSPAADTIAFSEGGVEAMRITSAGLVGIGTTSPASKLHVESTSGAAGSAVARLTVTGTNGLEVGQEFFSTLVSGSTTALRSGRIYSKFDGSSYVSSRLSFQSMTTSNVLVDTMHLKNGSVGIGTSSPNTKLAVEGSACEISINDTAGTIAGLRFRTSGTTKGVIQADSTSNLRFSSGSTEAMRILSSGNVGIGTSSPGERLTVAATANSAARITSTATTTALILDNTNANAWGSNLAIRTGGVAAGYFGTIGSLLGSTSQDITAYADTGNGFRVYTNGNNERMRITSAGNVGIGTSSPATKLDVNGAITSSGSANPYLALNNGTAISYVQVSSGALDVRVGGANPITFNTNSAERMRIDASGNVGIGTASPAARVDLGYTGGTVALRISRDASNRLDFYQGGGVSYIDSSPASAQLAFATVGTERMRINASGNVGIGTTAPSTKLHVTRATLTGAATRPNAVITLEDTANTELYLVSENTGNGQLRFGDTDSNYRGAVTYRHATDHMEFTTAASERMRIDTRERQRRDWHEFASSTVHPFVQFRDKGCLGDYAELHGKPQLPSSC